MRTLFYILTILILFSCKNDKNIEDEVLNCLASKIDDGSEISSIDFFASLKQMEIICQNEGYLSSLDKNGYIDFLDTIFSNNTDKLFDKINNQVPQLDNLGLSVILGNYKICIFDIMVSTDFKFDYLDEKMHQFEQLEMSGFSDYQPLASYIEDVNFENEKDRLFLLNLFYVYIWSLGNK